MRHAILSAVFCLMALSLHAQTREELKSEQAIKKDSIAQIQGRVDAIQKQIDAIPGWRFKAFGTFGGSISEFNNWYAQGSPNNSSGTIGFTINANADLIQEKFFWRNTLGINLGWVKLDDKDDPNDDGSFNPTTDVFNLTTLYGHKLSEKLALSTLAEYRTTLLDNFNDPGYLDFGIGATWTPVTDLVVVIQPLDYNIVFSSRDTVFESSFGSKILADYTRKIGAINFKSNLSMFLSYKSSNLHNWTWINSFGYTLWKKIGVGFDFGLRSNKQEALNYALGQVDPMNPPAELPNFENVDNDLQTYWLFGLSYAF